MRGGHLGTHRYRGKADRVPSPPCTNLGAAAYFRWSRRLDWTPSTRREAALAAWFRRTQVKIALPRKWGRWRGGAWSLAPIVPGSAYGNSRMPEAYSRFHCINLQP